MSDTALCFHCRRIKAQHAGGMKCLYGSTSFKQAVCPECKQSIATPANEGAGGYLYHALCPREAVIYKNWPPP